MIFIWLITFLLVLNSRPSAQGRYIKLTTVREETTKNPISFPFSRTGKWASNCEIKN
jgi:hypothetical protein